MNKLLIVLLVVCLVSVHAFVKRDAPETQSNDLLEKAKKGFEDFGDTLKKTFDPEKIKEGWNKFSEDVGKALENMKPATTPKE